MAVTLIAKAFTIKLLMRHFAAECDSLQKPQKRTQNPPRATSWGFDPPSRHQITY
jgi:hypothetical protein